MGACGDHDGQTTTTNTDVPPLRAGKPDETPSDASVITVIREARALGLRTAIAPHIKVEDGTFRGEIEPDDRVAWYASYRTMLGHYAGLAQRADAGMLVVGSELVSMSKDTDAWETLIAHARDRFAGPLTYAANWVDEAEQVRFWDQLDQVGIDAYMPLTPDEATPSVDQLVDAWQPYLSRMRQVGDRAGML